MLSSSRLDQDITRNLNEFERLDSAEIRRETENEIREIAKQCEKEGMIKKSAYEGNFSHICQSFYTATFRTI